MQQPLNYGTIHKITHCVKKMLDELPNDICDILFPGEILYSYYCLHPQDFENITYSDFMQYIRHINEILLDQQNLNCPEIENLKNYGLHWLEYWYENDHIFEDSLVIDLSRFENLKTCNFSYIYINNIVNIPPNLEYMNIQYCEINHIGELPESLRYFNCNSNNIKVLPNIKDTKLQHLYCCSNLLRHIPPLPNTLEYLYCFQNRIRILPKLPKNLEYISCYSNRLSVLPELPDKLEGLYCNNNYLHYLPENLPRSLKLLYCNNNHISRLPDLPPFLRTLICNKNPMKEYPILPPSIHYVNIDGNVMDIEAR